MNKILITGASRGVGRTLANYFYKQGFYLILLSRRDDFLLEDFSDLKNIDFYSVDFKQPNELRMVLNKINMKHSFIPFIINNAGLQSKSNFGEYSWEEFEEDLNINVRAPFEIINFLLPNLKKNNFGRIINITSGAPLNCSQGFSRYSATKALLNTLTVTISNELSDNYDIKINLMSPGPVKTEMSPNANLNPNVCIPTVEYLLNQSKNETGGKFYWLGYEIPITPKLDGVDWNLGKATIAYKKII
jgi:3-oxoacyl-[acyl-carrier protein] reductase